MKRQHDGMAQPSGGRDGRRPRPRPSNGAAPGATRRRGMRELCCACRCLRSRGRGDCGRGRAIAVAADVADEAAVGAMIARTEAELGPATILVNNAGVAWQGTLDTYDREQVARMRQVKVDGVIHATRAVMGSMRARRYGRIVNLASIAAIGTALSGNAFYAATKAEVVMLTRRF